MTRHLLTGLVLLVSVGALGAVQHGTAEDGYYPPGYHGDTFTGTVTAVDDNAREITLTFTDPKHDKTESFVGVLEAGYTARWKDGTEHAVKPSDIPVGAKLKVYYMTVEKKVEGKKVKSSTVFLVAGVPNLRTKYLVFQPH